ncbi:MAG TPA: hypothetical protein VFA14_03565 [Herbaspirillum sp.]|nr:hypothetical protein [Herbaspirillum sp.]
MLASAALGASIAAPTHATAEYALQSGVSWYRFDNLFLFRNDSDNKLHTSDSAWSADLRGALFLPLPTGRSNLQLTASASQMHYSKFSAYTNSTGHGPYSLNRSKKQFDAMYTWAYGDLLHGHLRHRIDDRLYNYFGGEITPQTDPNGLPPRNLSNIEPEFPHIREDRVEIAWRASKRFDMPLIWAQQTLSYMVPGRAEIHNMSSHALLAAIRYTSGRKSTLSAGIRRNKARFPDRNDLDIARFDSGYTDIEWFANSAWRYTENTIVNAHLGAVTRRFHTLPERDRRFPWTELGFDWHFSARTTFYGNIWNRPQTRDEAHGHLYDVMTRGIQGHAIWQATPKTRVSLLGALRSQKSPNLAIDQFSTPSDNHDQWLRLGLRYDIDLTRRLAIRINAMHEKNVSGSDDSIRYRHSAAQLSLNYTFDNTTGPFDVYNPQGYGHARRQIENLR